MARRGWHHHRRRRRLANARALVLVDISNSYVISWVLLGAPESCYYTYLPTTPIVRERGYEKGGWRRPSTTMQRAAIRTLLSPACITHFLLEFFDRESRIIVPKRRTEVDLKGTILYACI